MASPRRRTARTVVAFATAVALAATLASCGDDAPTRAEGSAAAATSSAPDLLPCTAAALSGTYLYEIHGDQKFAEGSVPFLEVGRMVFDGKGGLTRVGTDSNSHAEARTSVAYEVAADCTGRLVFADGAAYRATVAPGGDSVTFFAAGAGPVQTALDGVADRVSSETTVDCSTATLAGTYQYRSRGRFGGEVHIEHGFEIYDGSGTLTNAFHVAGVEATQRQSGSYRVDGNCVAVVTYANGQTLRQYLAPDGGSFYWIQVDGFTQAGLLGGHEHRVSPSTDRILTDGRS